MILFRVDTMVCAFEISRDPHEILLFYFPFCREIDNI